MKQKFAQAVRILTTPPVFSALMCTLLYVLVPGSFASLGHYLLAIVCLSLLPVLAYPVSYLIPALRRGGRKTQRNLALVFSVLGYLIGFLAAVLDDGAAMERSFSERISSPAQRLPCARCCISRPAAIPAAAPARSRRCRSLSIRGFWSAMCS